MKKYLSYIVALTIILIGLSSCHTSAPRLDYKALAHIVSNLREKYYTQHWLCGGRIK